MDIRIEKIELIKMILDTDNPGIIKSIKEIFNKESKGDFWDTMPQHQKDEILLGIKEVEDGEIFDNEDFINKYR